MKLVLAFILFLPFFANSQVQYKHDESGNRISAILYVEKIQNNFSDSLFLNTTNNLKSEFNAMVFPNPINTFLNIQIDNNSLESIATIYDSQGRSIIKTKVLLNAVIDIEMLQSGMYILVLENEKQKSIWKIIKN